MKSKSKIIAMFVLTMFVVALSAKPVLSNSSFAALEQNYESIFNRYEQNVYEALFSINELRPYSIIQLDKTIDIYNNEWIEPERYAAMLDANDKEVLKKQVFLLIASMDIEKRQQLIEKINSWCINDLQMHFFISDFGIELHSLVASMYALPLTNNILDTYNERGKIDASKLEDIKINKAYHSALNIISSIEMKYQLEYHSKLLADLSMKYD